MSENFTGVIGIIFLRDNPTKYALIHNLKTGNITFPSGGREDTEKTPVESLKREIEEETGLLPKDYTIHVTPLIHEFTYSSKKRERAGQKAIQPIFLIESKKSKLAPLDLDVQIDGWYTAEEVLKKLTFSDFKEIFKKAIKYI